MKPYNERLPLIDEAIDKIGEDMQELLSISNNYHAYLFKSKLGKYCWATRYHDSHLKGRTFCTRDELTQRVKEREAMKEYEYGVEYPCNGKKPDLPDDVLVEIWNQSHNKWLDPEPVSWIVWVAVVKFRIVDERWKPENKNDWHEKGEFPPAGIRCYVQLSGWKMRETFIVGMNDVGGCVFTTHGRDWDDISGMHASHDDPSLFHPLRTEEDELVELALSLDCEPHEGILSRRDFVKELIKAGLLRKP